MDPCGFRTNTDRKMSSLLTGATSFSDVNWGNWEGLWLPLGADREVAEQKNQYDCSRTVLSAGLQ